MRWTGLVSLIAVVLMSACTTVLMPMYGVREGKLAPCPAHSDCLSSQDQSPNLHIAPLTFTSNRQQARNDLLIAINAVGHGQIVSNHLNYLRVVYSIANLADHASQYFYQPEDAVDDVEFYIVPGRRIIEMRSVARLGLFDVGANRARLEKIRAAFAELQQYH